jgi:ABC-type sugar transport system permease subunit
MGLELPSERPRAGGSRPVRARLSAGDHRRLSRGYGLRSELSAWAFLLPVLVPFVLFLLIPAVGVFWYSFTKGGISGADEFVGLANWHQLLAGGPPASAIANTVKFAALSVVPSVILAIALAILLSRASRGGAVFRFLLYFPVLIPGVVAAMIWTFLLHPDFGVFNSVLRLAGGEPRNWLGADLALPVLALLDVWRNIGYWAIFFLAAILGFPQELFQAARLDGAGTWQRFRYLSLPLLKPITLLALVMGTVWGLQIFDTVVVLTQGGPADSTVTIVYYIWNYAFGYNRLGVAAVLSVLLLVATLALTLVQMRLLRGGRTGAQ